MKIAVIEYNAGNTLSVLSALRRLGFAPQLTADPEIILEADRVILPGVGEASSAMRRIRASGLDRVIQSISSPFLGICLGMQLLCEESEEGDCDCLGIIPGSVRKFRGALKVPHMGWSKVRFLDGSRASGAREEDYFYFAHSYYLACGASTVARSDYIEPFSAAVSQGNFMGVQFHPEKSAFAGAALLRRFILDGVGCEETETRCV
jgi:glutamine amidotransferase